MKAFITGGAGFIGSSLAEDLLNEGHAVHVLDDLSTGSMKNIEHLKSQPGFRYTIGTIMNYPLLLELMDSCDVVFHLAAAVGVRLIVDSPVLTLETNIRGTEKVMESANVKKKKTLIASTSEIYGKSTKPLFSENDDMIMGPTVRSRWSYACSKAVDEFLALAYYREKGLPVVITRLFNTIGPRQTGRYGMVVPRFVKQALSGEPVTVFGDGTQTRSFTYVKDVTNALIKLATADSTTGEIFNIGNPKEVSILDLAKKVIALTGSTSSIEFVPYEKAYGEGFEDMLRRVPDISKIKKAIGFSPSMDLDEILVGIIRSFKADNRSAEFS